MLRPRLFPLLSLLVLLTLAGVIRAQQPPQPQQMPPSLPPPIITGLPTSPASVTSPVNGAASAEVPTWRYVGDNAPISEILAQYESLTGKHVIVDNTLQGTLTIHIPKQITRSEAIRVIETTLTLNQFTVIHGPGDIVKVLGLGKPARNYGVPIFSELSQVPESDQTVSYLLRLRYIDAAQVQALLQQYIPPTSSTAFIALPQSGALIITDAASSVRRIVSLLDLMDQPAAPVVQKFIRLERADATKAVEFLNAVFESKGGGAAGGAAAGGAAAGAAGVRRPIRRVNEEGQPIFDPAAPAPGGLAAGLAALSGEGIIQGRIVLTPDIRTNRVHVVTQPINLPLVERLLAAYDSDTPFAEPVRRTLRYIRALDALPILQQALTEPGTENAQNGSNPNGANPASRANNSSNSSRGSGNLFGNNSSSGDGSSGGGSSIGSEELTNDDVDTRPTAVTIGTSKIIADPSSNTIILLAGAEAKDKVFQILRQLDVPTPQLVIRTVIGELSLGRNTEFGLSYLLRRNRQAILSQFNGGFTTAGTATTGTTTTTDTTATGGTTPLSTLTALATGLPTGFTGLAGIISVTKSFDVILSALDATNRFNTINRPVLFASNNKKAVIISGQDIAVPTGTVSSVSNVGTNNLGVGTSISFKTVALQLEVIPLINADQVNMRIVQKLDSLAAGQSVQVAGNTIPTIARREVKSEVTVPNGGTVVLGGLITQTDSRASNNVPLLSKIPVVGELFKSRTNDKNRSELLILLHPEVLNNPALLESERMQEENKLYMEPNLEAQLDPLPRVVRRALPVIQAK